MLSSVDKKYLLIQKNLVPILFVILFVMIFPMVGTSSQKHEAFGIPLSSTVNVSHDDGISHSEKILASGNDVYLVWLNGTATGPHATPPMINDILFAKSTDSGNTFSIPIKVSNVPNDDLLPPVIAHNGNNVYISWIQSNSGNPSLNFARSIDGGITFSSPIQINQGISGPQEEYIAANGDNVYIAFTNSASAGVFFISSIDGGISFTLPQQMSSGSNNHDPKILVKGTNVYLAWDDQDNGVYFRKSADSGNTFGNPINISRGIQGGGIDIAISGNYVYATWFNFGVSNQILFARSTDDGNSFGNPITLSNTGISGFYPKLAASGNDVHVTWLQELSGPPYYDIDIVTSSDNGNTFNNVIPLTGGTIQSNSPQINATANNVYVSWIGYTSGSDVFYSSSSTNGLTFTSPSNISQDNLVQDQHLASSQNNVYLAWQDNSVGNGDIFVSVNPSIPVNTLTLSPTVSPNTVVVNNQVTLDANPAGGIGPVNYQWTITSAPSGSTATLSIPGSQSPMFIPDVPGTYQFSVTANAPTNNPPIVGPQSVTLTVTGLPSTGTLPSPSGSGQITFNTDNGGFTSLNSIPSSSLPTAPPPGSYPFGFFSWSISTNPITPVTVTITSPTALDPNAQYYKLIGGNWIPLAPPLTTISGNTMAITIMDNGPLDGNPTPGIISDPGAIAIPTNGKITGGGKIVKGIDFSFEVTSDVDARHATKGTMEYHDKSGNIEMHSRSISFLSVDTTMTHATFVGKGDLDKTKGTVTILASVTDPDKTGDHDSFSIIVTDSSGKVLYHNSGNVKGHIEIHKFADKDDKSDGGHHDNGKNK